MLIGLQKLDLLHQRVDAEVRSRNQLEILVEGELIELDRRLLNQDKRFKGLDERWAEVCTNFQTSQGVIFNNMHNSHSKNLMHACWRSRNSCGKPLLVDKIQVGKVHFIIAL